LLDCRRAGLRRELARRQETFREDASNADRAMPRNRLRHELMPVVERLAPGGVRALARLAGLAEDDEAVLTGGAIETARSVVLSRVGEPDGSGAIDIDAAALRSVPPAIGRRVLRALVAELQPGAAPSAAHLQAIWDLVRADTRKGHLDLAGLTVERSLRRKAAGSPKGGVVTLKLRANE
jgi:tRNA(Ile)-lysidine synthase